MPRCDALVLRLHPDDPDLLEVMLREGESERRVARAPISNPRTWEWTTPPSWLRAESVDAMIDEADLSRLDAGWLPRGYNPACAGGGVVVYRVGGGWNSRIWAGWGGAACEAWSRSGQALTEVPVSIPVGSLARMARHQASALATLGARTGEFVQVCV
jgi:hypothetical protein